MWKFVSNVAKGFKTAVKYGSLAVVLVAILGNAATELEKWSEANKPNEGGSDESN